MNLFSLQDIRRARGPRPDRLEKIMIGIDPPATPHAATCGIIVVGRDMGRAYVLADLTLKTPNARVWAQHIAHAAFECEADRVVMCGGDNQDMVRPVLYQAGVPCEVRAYKATRNLERRAEPVAALYEKSAIIHCSEGLLSLEDELLNLGRGSSTDRAEALIASVTELLLARAPTSMRSVH
jgi:phage terminase large subunit-like protein